MLLLPSVPKPLNEQDVLVACHSVARTGKAYNHSEEKLPSYQLRNSCCMRTSYFLTNPMMLDHLFGDKGLETPSSTLS